MPRPSPSSRVSRETTVCSPPLPPLPLGGKTLACLKPSAGLLFCWRIVLRPYRVRSLALFWHVQNERGGATVSRNLQQPFLRTLQHHPLPQQEGSFRRKATGEDNMKTLSGTHACSVSSGFEGGEGAFFRPFASTLREPLGHPTRNIAAALCCRVYMVMSVTLTFPSYNGLLLPPSSLSALLFSPVSPDEPDRTSEGVVGL